MYYYCVCTAHAQCILYYALRHVCVMYYYVIILLTGLNTSELAVE